MAGEQPGDNMDSGQRLSDLLNDWTHRLSLPRLSSYGVSEADLPAVIADSRGSSMKTNPLVLTDGEIEELLRARL
jgi:alcohol dehydrogenase